ncbi:unnamed protein product [Spirodela intermedia]|uniref:Uncharacterized protein n=1 Tax=Spirodela intermedia TaxID=51605 RepID=A0A7I8JD42_SPIIN|nr:unnamed protein product [Spirodela intermedia]CAA6668088.1 unnamed protein product [Spirodela intermedia]
MGCVYSRVEREEAVRRCRERRRLMKHLVGCRARFAAAHLAYLQSLRNTGATLRQFAEADSSIAPGDAASVTTTGGRRIRPPPSPPPLPPSPPPLPPFSPRKKPEDSHSLPVDGESAESRRRRPSGTRATATRPDCRRRRRSTVQPGACGTPSTPRRPNWRLRSPIRTPAPPMPPVLRLRRRRRKTGRRRRQSLTTKRTSGKKTLPPPRPPLAQRRSASAWNFKSAKVFSTLSWRWSLRSLPSGGPDCPPGAAINARQPGRHSTTLDRLFAEEQKLYKEVKEEETRKLEFGKKVALLRKQEARGQDWTITARTRLSMEELQTEIVSLQESIGRTCSSISKLRDEELHPQLVELCSGFMEMWRTMYQCHQVQNHIAQQMNHLHGLSAAEPTTESHIQAASQLETEVDTWHSSLHGLLRAQREYAHTLNHFQWSVGPSRIFRLCEEWQLALDRLPEKVPAEAIKSFISIVQSISSQLAEEHRHQKRSSRLEKRLMRELDSWMMMVMLVVAQPPPESARRAKMAARRRRAEEEKTKYLSSVSQSRAMMINNLQTSLPNVFQALMGFASVCVPAFEGICRSPEAVAAAAAGGRASGGSSPAR